MIPLQSRYDVPFDKDATTRFLPWIIAFMVFLAALAMTAAMVVSDLIGQWNADIAGTLTVQVPPHDPTQGMAAGAGVEQVLEVIRGQPGVIEARPLPHAEIKALLEPWLGNSELPEQLPLPVLIDVHVQGAADAFDPTVMEARLRGIRPDITVEDHRLWLKDLVVFARSIEVVALLVMALVAAASIGTVVYATRAGFAIHNDVITVLHQAGAQDNYIANQFQRHALVLGIRGGLLGLVCAGVILGILHYLAGRVQSTLVPEVSLGLFQLVAILAVPLIATTAAMLTARMTVMRSLQSMP